MKKYCIMFVALVMVLFICVNSFAANSNYTTGTPWPDVDLEGVVTKDMNASIKDNFVLAVNKEKILALTIPEGYPEGGTMTDLSLKQREDLKNMFLGDAPKGHDTKLAYDLFHLMMDWDSRNTQGVVPLKKATDAIEAVNTIDGLNEYFLKTPVEDQPAALWVGASIPSLEDSSRNVLAVSSCPLLLGDSAEYGKLTDYGAIKKQAYSELARKMLIKLGYAEREALLKIENCLAFEAKLAPFIFSNEQKHAPDFLKLSNNHFTYEELSKVQGRVPVLPRLARVGYPAAKEYIVLEPRFLAKLDELYTKENLSLIKDYLIVHGAVKASDILDRECYEWSYACKNAISGASGMLPDETAFSSKVADMLEWPVARLYAETYLKQEDKDRISMLIDRLLDAYHGVINEAVFLSDATKANAIRKLEAIDKRVLFPDSWEKYECGELNFASPKEGGTLWQAIRSITAYEVAKNVREYAKPVDKAKWDETPHTVNCLYDPQANAMYIMGAFSQGAMYRSDMSDEELLAKLGWVIGHEISHAFDSSGAQFDKDGNMADWWTEKDYAAFLARNEKMVAYYNNMHPWAGQDFHGSIMTGEACADMAGMKVVLRIASKIKGFDYDKLFRSFTDVWLVKQTIQSSYAQINDPHPMGYLRINCTLQQFDDFLNFYGIKKGDGMYLAPEDRVAIW